MWPCGAVGIIESMASLCTGRPNLTRGSAQNSCRPLCVTCQCVVYSHGAWCCVVHDHLVCGHGPCDEIVRELPLVNHRHFSTGLDPDGPHALAIHEHGAYSSNVDTVRVPTPTSSYVVWQPSKFHPFSRSTFDPLTLGQNFAVQGVSLPASAQVRSNHILWRVHYADPSLAARKATCSRRVDCCLCLAVRCARTLGRQPPPHRPYQ